MAFGGGTRDDGETVCAADSRSRQEDQCNEWKNGDGHVSTKCVCIVDCACARACGFTYNRDGTYPCVHECVCADVPIWSVTSQGEAQPGDAVSDSVA